ncbi:sugar MFS transporter [Dyadobacter aurulentus]|uniref:sugar MFS transporter n=1 Tax=Dyadobacter sp. UC 10 TaxID=2605428 RepID=UPI0011F13D40|nr:sugar MFS transporter [Dyadobacter sp. UC 10]KAA0992321.1 sugar MFS transporter [Dyadobacter sp. UC 10]
MRPLVIIGFLFFVFGFVTWMNSVLVPYLQIACELNHFQSQLVGFAFYISYFVMAVPSGMLLKRTGFKNGMALGLAVMAVGSLVFIPAAFVRTFELFLIGLFIQGTGLAILQTASNPYVTVLGPMEGAAQRISLMGICNGVAGILGPLALGFVLLDNTQEQIDAIASLSVVERAKELDALALKVINPYIVITIVLIALAVFVQKSSLPELEGEADDSGILGNKKPAGIWSHAHLLLGVATLFFYTGVEVIAGNTIIGYASFKGVDMASARFFTSFTLTSMLAGYLIGIFSIPRFISQRTALTGSAVLGVAFALAAIFTEGSTSVFFIAFLGFANALVFPSIWPLALDGLGALLNLGSALLVMAIAGGAVIPLVYGYYADQHDPQSAYWLLVPCYLFILYYSLSGYKAGKREETFNA